MSTVCIKEKENGVGMTDWLWHGGLPTKPWLLAFQLCGWQRCPGPSGGGWGLVRCREGAGQPGEPWQAPPPPSRPTTCFPKTNLLKRPDQWRLRALVYDEPMQLGRLYFLLPLSGTSKAYFPRESIFPHLQEGPRDRQRPQHLEARGQGRNSTRRRPSKSESALHQDPCAPRKHAEARELF